MSFDLARAPIRLVLVEDHTILRNGIKALLDLESDVTVVGEYACVDSGLDGIRQLQPDVVVVDLSLPNRSGLELVRELQRLSPRSRKLVLTASDGLEYIRAALGAGADGYVLKDARSVELLHAIRTVSRGERFLCKAIASKVLAGFLTHDKPPPSPSAANGITAREREVLTRVAQGHPNKKVALDLGLSPKTVAKHRANLMRKLNLHNAAAVTMYAIRHGLADFGPPGIQSAALACLSF
jgi:DNA-binding NarL/FixJ family response regulator